MAFSSKITQYSYQINIARCLTILSNQVYACPSLSYQPPMTVFEWHPPLMLPSSALFGCHNWYASSRRLSPLFRYLLQAPYPSANPTAASPALHEQRSGVLRCLRCRWLVIRPSLTPFTLKLCQLWMYSVRTASPSQHHSHHAHVFK